MTTLGIILFESTSGQPVELWPAIIPLALLGLGVGFIAGMFGVGGGFLITPILNIFFGVPMPVAVGTALSQQCGTTVTTLLKYRRLKLGEPRIGLVMIGGALIGTHAGTTFLEWLKDLGRLDFGQRPPIATVALQILYITVLAFTVVLTFREAMAARKRAKPRGDTTIPGPLSKIKLGPFIDLPAVQLTHISVPVLCYIGFLVGFLSGLMGIGGGVAFVPILIYGFGLSIRNTAGSSMLLLFAIVCTGTVVHAWHGNVSLWLAVALLIGSTVGAQLGALTTYRLSNRKLRWAFLGLLVLTILMIARDLWLNLR